MVGNGSSRRFEFQVSVISISSRCLQGFITQIVWMKIRPVMFRGRLSLSNTPGRGLARFKSRPRDNGWWTSNGISSRVCFSFLLLVFRWNRYTMKHKALCLGLYTAGVDDENITAILSQSALAKLQVAPTTYVVLASTRTSPFFFILCAYCTNAPLNRFHLKCLQVQANSIVTECNWWGLFWQNMVKMAGINHGEA